MLPWINTKHSKRKIAVLALLATSVVFLFLFIGKIHVVHAQQEDTFGIQGFDEATMLAGNTDIRVIIARIIRAVLGLLGIITVGLIMYAGFTIMTAGGNEEKISRGKKIITNAVIGLIIIMSAFTIVQFVLNALTEGVNRVAPSTEQPIGIDDFIGSGALGDIIKDHYPFRDQIDVKRNTAISVTFREPIDPSTVLENTNGTCWEKENPADCVFEGDNQDTPKYGDCIRNLPEGVNFNLREHCDLVKISSVALYETTDVPFADLEDDAFVLMYGLANYPSGQNSGVVNFKFKPFNSLGNALDPVGYSVRLTDGILRDEIGAGGERTSAFPYGAGFYQWKFETGTTLDLNPPHITDTVPALGEGIPRNQGIQIWFNEEIDPVSSQGIVGQLSSVVFGTSDVSGEWKLVNGYRTLEFISDVPCGTNACGDTIFCINIDCPEDDESCTQDFETLTRTAELKGLENPFEAWDFTGIMDMSGNALDGNNNNIANNKPVITSEAVILEEERREDDPSQFRPDNFGWHFTVFNRIDRHQPYIERINPTVDEEGVYKYDPLSFIFKKSLMLDSLYDIDIEEHEPFEICTEDGLCHIEPVSRVPRSEYDSQTDVTKVNIEHREFGPNQSDRFYFPIVPSTIKSLDQNCFYPGYGPSQPVPAGTPQPDCEIEFRRDGTVLSISGCILSSFDDLPTQERASHDTGCPHTSSLAPTVGGNIDECLSNLESISEL